MPRLLPLAIALSACTGGGPITDPSTDDDDPLDSEVAGDPYPSGVDFSLRVGDAPVDCAKELRDLGTSMVDARIADARFFVSDLVFSGPGGAANFVPDQALPYQNVSWGLLDFEDATDVCTGGTPGTNSRLSGYIPEGEWDTLTFNLGLPFEAAHAPIAGAAAPLDDAATWRTAQLGRIFLKLDLRPSAGGPNADWSTHIASEACKSSSSEIAPETPCDRPSLARVSVPYDPFAEGLDPLVVLDVGALLLGVDLEVDQAGPRGCLSRSDETYDCSPIYRTLGMAFGTAACDEDCAGQTAFRTVCRSTSDGSEIACPQGPSTPP